LQTGWLARKSCATKQVEKVNTALIKIGDPVVQKTNSGEFSGWNKTAIYSESFYELF